MRVASPIRRVVLASKPYAGALLLPFLSGGFFAASRYIRAHLAKPLLDEVLVPSTNLNAPGALELLSPQLIEIGMIAALRLVRRTGMPVPSRVMAHGTGHVHLNVYQLHKVIELFRSLFQCKHNHPLLIEHVDGINSMNSLGIDCFAPADGKFGDHENLFVVIEQARAAHHR